MSIEKGEEEQAKGIHNILNKIAAENFPNLKKELFIQIQEASRAPNKLQQNRTSPQHIIIKTDSTENGGKNIESCKRAKQIIYKGKPIKITADFSIENLKAKRTWSKVFQKVKENNLSPRILFQAKLSFRIDGGIKVFHNKQNKKYHY
jgi:Zn-dependent oligopeptidase